MEKFDALEQENKYLRAELEKSQYIFKEIENFSSQLGLPTELKDIYRNCLHLFKDLLQLDYTTLFLCGNDPDSLTIFDTIGFPETMVGQFTLCKGTGLPSLVLNSRQVEIIEDFSTEKRVRIPDIINQNKIHSAIAVPMLHNNELFGVIIGHTTAKTLFTDEEQSIALIFASQSATAIKNATHIQSLNISEKALLERSYELESIFENSMAGIMLLKGNRILVRCNKRLADFMGYESTDEMKGLNMRAFHLSEKRYMEIGKVFYDTLGAGKQIQMEYQLQKKDGSPIWCWLSGKALDHSSPPDLDKGVVWVVDDLSQRKKMEAQILKSRKLESFAILTGGLGHDFNNIITAILGNIDLSMAVLDSKNKAFSFLQHAKEATLRAKDLTARLQTFSRTSKPVLQANSLPKLIQESATTFNTKNILITCHFPEDLPHVDMDSGQITKAIGSLLTNGALAMPDGGEIHLTCSDFINNGDITGLKNGHFVKTTVSDTGHGIPSDILDKIFDPYFTTRTRGSIKGSGLGLATVHSILKRHKGYISAKSTPGSGASFTFYLPVSRTACKTPHVSAARINEHASGNLKKKILIMDDDESIRDMIQQILVLIGYDVAMAAEGDTAISLYRSAMGTDEPFNAVIMDLTIPNGMGGEDAIQEILLLDKHAKIIVSSGDSMDPIMTHYKDYGFIASVNKPFDVTELHKILSQVFSPNFS